MNGYRYCVKIFDRRHIRTKFDDLSIRREIYFFQRAQGNDRIVHYVEMMEDRDKIYVVMELVMAENLLSRVVQDHQRGLPESIVQILTHSLLDGIRFLHSRNIIHRDLEPSNVIVDSVTNEVKIIDFGDATDLDSSLSVYFGAAASCDARSISLDGKNIAYSAPEIISPLEMQGGGPTAQSDMWSVGVIVYFCLFGVSPFSSSNTLQPYTSSSTHEQNWGDINTDIGEYKRPPSQRLSSRIKRAEYMFPTPDFRGSYNVSRQARQFIIGLIQPDPSIRLTADEALAHPWLSYPELPPIILSNASTSSSRSHPLRRLFHYPRNKNHMADDSESSGTSTRPSVSSAPCSSGSTGRLNHQFQPMMVNAWRKIRCRRFSRQLEADNNDTGVEVIDFVQYPLSTADVASTSGMPPHQLM
jgi:serine/threonine protein kinase